jgi:hypothetical protein
MKRLLFAFLIIAITVVLIIICVPSIVMNDFFLYTYTNGALTSFSSKEEAFIFVGQGKSVSKSSSAGRLLRESLEMSAGLEKVGQTLLVFHVRGGLVTRSEIKSFGGSPIAFRGRVYWSKGGPKKEGHSNRWCWDGSRFLEVSPADWAHTEAEIRRESSLDSEVNAKEGWTESSLVINRDRARSELVLTNQDSLLAVEMKSISKDRTRMIILLERVSGGPSETLINQVLGYSRITPEEYREIKKGIQK